MNEAEAKKALIALWLENADDALHSAELELNGGHTNFALNRLYYACFYVVTALPLKEGKQFTRHSAVKSEFVRSHIQSGHMPAKWSKFYQKLFDDRQRGDYVARVRFPADDVSARLVEAREFVRLVRGLIDRIPG